jgi:hypothetical protein
MKARFKSFEKFIKFIQMRILKHREDKLVMKEYIRHYFEKEKKYIFDFFAKKSTKQAKQIKMNVLMVTP